MSAADIFVSFSSFSLQQRFVLVNENSNSILHFIMAKVNRSLIQFSYSMKRALQTHHFVGLGKHLHWAVASEKMICKVERQISDFIQLKMM